jgi:DNA-binding IclR family transcriptional regulator
MSGVTAVTRALSILDAFGAGEAALSLGEIARRTKLHKTTVLRIARTLAAVRYLVRLDDGSWRLGPSSGWLGSRYNLAFDVILVEPVLRVASRKSGDSASYYVREGNARVCVARVEGPQSASYPVRIGEMRPLDKGAPGRVLLAYSGEPGHIYEGIRRLGYHVSLGERDARIASIAFPVFGINHSLIGCVSLFGPVARYDQVTVTRYARILRKAAAQLTFELSVRRSKKSGHMANQSRRAQKVKRIAPKEGV